jgi:hypothetical protein
MNTNLVFLGMLALTLTVCLLAFLMIRGQQRQMEKERFQFHEKELLLLNRIMAKDPMTLGQLDAFSNTVMEIDPETLRMNDEAELWKVNDSQGVGEILVEMGETYDDG